MGDDNFKRPRHIPGQIVFEWKPEMVAKANPLGLAASGLELLALLRREHGAVKIEPLWPIGASVLAMAGGPLMGKLITALTKKLPANIQPVVKELAAAASSAVAPEDRALADEARLRLRVTLPPGEDVEAVVKKLASAAGIDTVEPMPYLWGGPPPEPKSNRDVDAAFPPPTTPDGAGAFPVKPAGFWPVQQIERPKEWDDLALSNIAVLDSGADAQHPGLKGAVDYATKASRKDTYGHGTFVSHVIAGRAAQATAKLGLDPKEVSDTPSGVLPKARIWAANVFDSLDLGDGEREYYLDLARYSLELRRLAKRGTARLKQIDVVNLSLGSIDADPMIKKDLDALEKAGILVVAAAGNSPEGESWPVMYPAAYPMAISVGALAFPGGNEPWAQSNEMLPDESARETGWDVCAPGDWVLSAYPMQPHNHFGKPFSGWLSGTSMAAPYVTAAVAVLRAQGFKTREDVLAELRRVGYWKSNGGYVRLKCPAAAMAAKKG